MEGDERWWRQAANGLADRAVVHLLAHDTDTATFILTRRGGQRSVLKAARGSKEKLANLRFQWNALSSFHNQADFPGPRPLRYYAANHGMEAIEISYLRGKHPKFESGEDFHVYGVTIARLHNLSKGMSLAGAPVWNLSRIAIHFENPRLLSLMSNIERRIVETALARFGPRFQRHLDARIWTGLVHSDCHRHNVLIEDGRGSLIDFGECGLGVLFWDLGVAVADSAVDAPKRAAECRSNLLSGYLSLMPEGAPIIEQDLEVFEAMRCLEVMTWPVSDWTAERLAGHQNEAKKNIKLASHHIEALLSTAVD